ncbi:MAG: FAD:protein FMN transferase [Alphaproteobacteria bacterium]|nr:FAD:protein FMN transferase [Alphaproteobacteria bacterium]
MNLDHGQMEGFRGCRCQKHRHARPFMGKSIAITTLGLGEACARRAFALAFECTDALAARLDTRGSDSELMRLWDAPAGFPVKVSDSLWHLLKLANEIAFRTDGLFDIAATGSGGCAHWTDVDLSTRGYVRLRKPLRLDVGGLVKGYAADIAVQALREMGAKRGMVDTGGVMRAFGPQEWRVQYHLECGAQPLPVPLAEGALAGGGQPSGGLYDPRTDVLHSGHEWAAIRLMVRAGTASLADGLAKVAMLAPSRAQALLPQIGASVAMLTKEGAHALDYAS